MSRVGELWTWLSRPRTRSVLAFIGGGLAAVIAGLWQLYLHFAPAPAPAQAPASIATAVQPPQANIDASAVKRLQASQQRALDAEAGALDKLSEQIGAAGSQPPPAPTR